MSGYESDSESSSDEEVIVVSKAQPSLQQQQEQQLASSTPEQHHDSSVTTQKQAAAKEGASASDSSSSSDEDDVLRKVGEDPPTRRTKSRATMLVDEMFDAPVESGISQDTSDASSSSDEEIFVKEETDVDSNPLHQSDLPDQGSFFERTSTFIGSSIEGSYIETTTDNRRRTRSVIEVEPEIYKAFDDPLDAAAYFWEHETLPTVDTLQQTVLMLLHEVKALKELPGAPSLIGRLRSSVYVLVQKQGLLGYDSLKLQQSSAWVQWDLTLTPLNTNYLALSHNKICIEFLTDGYFDIRAKVTTGLLANSTGKKKKKKKAEQEKHYVIMYLDGKPAESSISEGSGTHTFNTIMHVECGSRVCFCSSTIDGGGMYSASLLNDLTVLFVRK